MSMIKIPDRWTRAFTEAPVPAVAFHVTRSYLCGLRTAGRTRAVMGHAVRPLAPGVVEPSFDRRNLARPEALEAAVKDAVRRLGPGDGPASVLLPETCFKTAHFAFGDLPSSPAEREQVLRWRLAKTLPLKPGETRLAFDVQRVGDQDRAFCVLASDPVVREYEETFARAGLKIRFVGLPTVHLLGLVPREGADNVLVVNVEDDHVALLAVVGGEAILLRVKSFAAGAAVWTAAAAEVETTVHYLEDRERVRIDAVWVRSVASGQAEDGLAILKSRVPVQVRALVAPGPALASTAERALLAPLMGQVS
jgi:hypothetical protein